ncbi:hypothetical protein J9253_13930 [Thiothrix litoralis]|jgi:hypothetical protein|uniref:Holin n=1 Tax=Thiothrix litoralis TaxID=2891210 RepID=A0ABX7WP07_9GAMM|nr:hypothetical protein [Thiothrix litoralis]QTR45097.1 hypothetical protein J9253_13930 [Thiothrix litoralis]
MINDFYKIIQSTRENWIDALAFVMVAFFYGLSVLQLPVPEIVQMFGILAIFSLGMNTILSSSQHSPVQPQALVQKF